MLKSNELENPNSCLNNALSGEPIFVLRAHDAVAPSVVRAWAKRYISAKNGWENMNPRQREKYHEAMHLAQQMEDYARAQGWRP